MSQPIIQEQQDELIENRKELQQQIINYWKNEPEDDPFEYEALKNQYIESLKDSLRLAMSEFPYDTKIIVDTLYELLRYGKGHERYKGFDKYDDNESLIMKEVICCLLDNMNDEAFDEKLKYPILSS